MKNYQKMNQDYPSDISSQVGEVIPMQNLNPRPIPNTQIQNQIHFENSYNRQPPAMFPPSHSIDYPPRHEIPQNRLPIPPPPNRFYMSPSNIQIIPQTNMIPVRIPNYAHNESQPIMIICPCCKERVITQIKRTNGKATYAASLLICIVSPIFAWIPFCAKKKCKDIRHYCPSCGMKVGKKQGQICG